MNLELKNINFFRILFTFVIIYGHIIQHWMMTKFGSMEFFKHLLKHTSYNFGYICEMFFIISGFFMFYTFSRNTTFKSFIVNKIARLWPVIAFSVLVCFILSLLGIITYDKYGNITALLFLSNSFIINHNNIGSAWYINVLFWTFILYFTLFKIIKPENRIPVVGIIVFIVYSILFNKEHLYASPKLMGGGITYYLLRGIAGMGWGYLIACLYSSWSLSSVVTLRQKIFYGILECYLLFLIYKWTIVKSIPQAVVILVFLFSVLFILFLAQRGFLSRLLNNDICFKFGQYCFSIYLVQDFMYQILYKVLWSNPHIGVLKYPVLNIFLGMLFVGIAGIIVYYIIEKPFKNIIKKLFQ